MKKITIKECCDSILEIMHSKNYSESSLQSYERIFTDFLRFCETKDIVYFDMLTGIEYVNSVTGMQLTDLAQSGKNTKKYIVLLRAVRLIGEYSVNRIFVSRFSRFADEIEDDYWKMLCDRYLLYLNNDCAYKSRTIEKKLFVLRKMVEIFVRDSICSLDDVTRPEIEKVVSAFIHETPKSVSHNLSDLKQFFRFCYENRLSTFDVSSLFPVLKTAHETKISMVFTEEEVKTLLNSIDRESITGKRDYAILIMAALLGLRSVDIANLKLTDINWEAKLISIIQEKTTNNLTLPLLNDLGWSIIDYIKNGRPDVESDYLFLEHRAPFNCLTPGGISSIFTRRLHDAGIRIVSGKKYGIHSLRHTLGTTLLEKETSLPLISQILGHQSIKSTETYLKLNMKGLSECSIDPDRVFNR